MKIWAVSPSGYATIYSSNLEEYGDFTFKIYPNLLTTETIDLVGYLMEGPYDKIEYENILPSIISYKNTPISYPIDKSLIAGNDIRINLGSISAGVTVQKQLFVDKKTFLFDSLESTSILVAYPIEDYMVV